jgi:hypothetical protein
MRAKAASLRIRPRCDQAISSCAADRSESGLVAKAGCELVEEAGDLLVEHVGLVTCLEGALSAGAQGEDERPLGAVVSCLETESGAAGEQPSFAELAEFAAERVRSGHEEGAQLLQGDAAAVDGGAACCDQHAQCFAAAADPGRGLEITAERGPRSSDGVDRVGLGV